MKLVLVLVVMCLVGAALSKSVRHKRALGQTNKRGDLEKLLKLLLEGNEKGTAAKRGEAKTTKRGSGGNGKCKGPPIPPALGTIAKNLRDNDETFTLADLRNALTPDKRMLHQKRGPDPAKKIEECIEELLEDMVELEVDGDPEEICPFPENIPDVPEFDALFSLTGDRPTPLEVVAAFELFVPALVDANTAIALTIPCAIYATVEEFENPCAGPLEALGDAVFSLSPTAPDFSVVLTELAAVAPTKRKRGLFHWKRSKLSVNKRQGGGDGPGKRIRKCVKEAFEFAIELNGDDYFGTCDIDDYAPTTALTLDVEADPPPTVLEAFTAVSDLFDANTDEATDPKGCLWEWVIDEVFECDDDEEDDDDRKKK